MSASAKFQANPFVRGTKVRLVDDIAGYKAGSKGKVAVANGFTWKRYWVRFNDGGTVGHIDHNSLVKQKDYSEFLAARQHEATVAAQMAERAAQEAKAVTDSPAPTSGGGIEVQVNGVTIPQRLLDMSAAARKRLAN